MKINEFSKKTRAAASRFYRLAAARVFFGIIRYKRSGSHDTHYANPGVH
jgi:hypothetical protein